MDVKVRWWTVERVSVQYIKELEQLEFCGSRALLSSEDITILRHVG